MPEENAHAKFVNTEEPGRSSTHGMKGNGAAVGKNPDPFGKIEPPIMKTIKEFLCAKKEYFLFL